MKIAICAAAAAIFSSCTNYVTEDFKKFEELTWNKTDIQEFVIEIPSDTITADVLLHVRYASGFVYQNLTLAIEETAPSGETQTIPFTGKLRSDDGKYLGDGSGDIWDIDFPLKKHIRLARGTYRYRIGHTMPQDKLLMIMELGITAGNSK